MYELKHRKSFRFMQIQFEKNSCGFSKRKKHEFAAVASWLWYTIHHRMRTPYGHGVLIVLFVHNIFCMYQCLFQFSIHLFRPFFSSCCSFLFLLCTFWWLCRRSSFEDFIAYTTIPSGSRGIPLTFWRCICSYMQPLFKYNENFQINWILWCSLRIHQNPQIRFRSFSNILGSKKFRPFRMNRNAFFVARSP